MRPPLPIFDAAEFMDKTQVPSSLQHPIDYLKALEFLKSYTGSQGTFNAYRRDVERLFHWSNIVAQKSLGA